MVIADCVVFRGSGTQTLVWALPRNMLQVHSSYQLMISDSDQVWWAHVAAESAVQNQNAIDRQFLRKSLPKGSNPLIYFLAKRSNYET